MSQAKKPEVKKQFTKNVEKIATRVVKKQIEKQEETKTVTTDVSASLLKGSIVTYNLFNNMVRGTTGGSFIGDKFNCRGIKLNLYSATGSAFPGETTYVDVCIVSTPTYANLISLSSSDLISFNKLAYPSIEVDSDKAQVVWMKRLSLTPQYSGQFIGKRVIEYIRMNKILTYKEFSSSYALKNLNYYLVLRAFTANGALGVANSGLVNGGFTVYYKDS